MNALSRLRHWLLLGLASSAMLATPRPAQAANERYWVNVIIERNVGLVTDGQWENVWQEFRDAFLPSFQQSLPGRAKFLLRVDDRYANFYLVNATTSDFSQTRRSFRSIPSMLPQIPEMTIRIDGPYRGGPPPLAGLSFGGKGGNSAKFVVKERFREGQRKVFPLRIENNAEVPVDCSMRMSGSAFKPRNSRLRVTDSRGRNCTALLRRGGTISSKLLPGSRAIIGGKVAIGYERRSNLKIQTKASMGSNMGSAPATLYVGKVGVTCQFGPR